MAFGKPREPVMKLWDAHAHLQDERLAPCLASVLERARAAGVEALVCCGSHEEDWDEVGRIASLNPWIRPAFGLHPWCVEDKTAAWPERLRALLERHPCAGVGEIGLDHALKPRRDKDQAEAFALQLALARDLKRPATIHCRQAWEALLGALGAAGTLERGFVVHAYSGPPDLVVPLADRGAYFSFAGSVTRPGNRRAARVVPLVPSDRLLIETDAPDILPTGIETPDNGRLPVNEPAHLVLIARTMASLRGVSIEEIAEQTWHNAERLFGAQGALP